MPLHYTLKTVKTANLCLAYFTTIKKIYIYGVKREKLGKFLETKTKNYLSN